MTTERKTNREIAAELRKHCGASWDNLREVFEKALDEAEERGFWKGTHTSSEKTEEPKPSDRIHEFVHELWAAPHGPDKWAIIQIRAIKMYLDELRENGRI